MVLQERRELNTEGDVATRRRGRQRPTLALGLAASALICAVVGGWGPAQHLQTAYTWPPPDLPTATPQTLWYTPLLLSRHVPESLSAMVPCRLPPALPRAETPTIVLATARDPVSGGGLAVVRTHDRLAVRIGNETLATVSLPAAATGTSCSYRLHLGDGRWFLAGGPNEAESGGSLDTMPNVVGLYSALDLRIGTPPSIELTTAVHGTRTRTHQKIFWIVAVLAALTALLLVGAPLRSTRRRGALGVLREATAHVGIPDAIVAVVLVVWWILGPAFYDDGWVAARQGNFGSSGGFSAYYSSFGVNLPLDYWLEWVQHWVVESSSALLVMRIPALICLAGTWILCRWLVARAGSTGHGAARWALVCGFAVGALAWGMTFRPEPVLALLVTGVLVCTVRFLEAGTASPLVVSAVLVALSLSAHPAGIVAFAPLLVAMPALVRWTRSHGRSAITIAAGAAALLVVLVTVGSDFQQRRADIASLRAYGDETAGWREEISRYASLGQSPYGTPLRRESVVLIVLAVLAYLLRRRREGREPLPGLPTAALGVALVLLITTPTKWPWHFGALIGLAAVAIAIETQRFVAEGRASRGWNVRPFLVIAVAVVAAAWSWDPRNPWGELDLRTLHWRLGIERVVTFPKLAGALPVALLLVLALVEFRRRRTGSLQAVPWRIATWTVPIVAVPLIAFTAGVLADDTSKTDSWTLGRQNLEALTGSSRCGLADDALVPSTASMRELVSVGTERLAKGSAVLPPSPVRNLPGFVLGPPPSQTVPARSAWFRLPQNERFGFFLTGAPGSADALYLEWGRLRAGRLQPLDVDGVSTSFEKDARPRMVAWRFYGAGSLPTPPDNANAVRILLRSEVMPGTAVGLTAPVRYQTRKLAGVLEHEGAVLALPNLLPYVPCVHQPTVSDVAMVPDAIIGFATSIWPLGTGTSPFDGIPDVYRLVRLPLSDSIDPPGDVAIYEVDRRIDGAVVAPPVEKHVS